MNQKGSPFRMTPDQHRRRAVQLRALGTAKAKELAGHHDNLAMLIEIRLKTPIAAPPIAPEH
jgi:hypothetical protein